MISVGSVVQIYSGPPTFAHARVHARELGGLANRAKVGGPPSESIKELRIA